MSSQVGLLDSSLGMRDIDTDSSAMPFPAYNIAVEVDLAVERAYGLCS